MKKVCGLFFCALFAFLLLFRPIATAAPGDVTDPFVTKSWTDDYVETSFAAIEAKIAEMQKSVASLQIRPTIILYLNSTKAYVNGLEQSIDVAPSLKQDCTFVPLRFIGEKMGAKVDWDEKNQQVLYSLAGKKVVLTIGSSSMTVDGVQQQLIAAPFLAQERTMVPLRAVAEAFGFQVDWLEAEKKIEIK